MKVKVRFDLGRWLIGFKIGAQLHSSLISAVNWQTQYLSVYIGPLCVQLYRTITVSEHIAEKFFKSKCDCGAASTGEPHANYCSLNKK